MEEACLLADASRVTVSKWIRKGQILTIQIGSARWIARREFEDLLEMGKSGLTEVKAWRQSENETANTV